MEGLGVSPTYWKRKRERQLAKSRAGVLARLRPILGTSNATLTGPKQPGKGSP